jgi:lipoprotein-anchoring transpeptidase ErfK/SrfK
MLKLLAYFAVLLAILPTNSVATAQEIRDVSLLIVRSQRRVFVYQAGRAIVSYPVAIGKPGWETPVGVWKVREKILNPAWTNFVTRRVMAPGKNNPMGSRWIGFWTDGRDEIGFHGTQNVKSIGEAASHGCVRMKEADVQDLFDRVEVGTIVEVVESTSSERITEGHRQLSRTTDLSVAGTLATG